MTHRRRGSRDGWKILALAGLLAGCGEGDDPARPGNRVVPQSWQGVWEIRWAQTDCGSPDSAITTSQETFCSGADVATLFPRLLDLCPNAAVDITPTTLTFACNESGTAPGCSYRTTITLQGSVDEQAGTLAGSGQFAYTADPQGGECGTNECFGVAITGTRLDPDPPGCISSR